MAGANKEEFPPLLPPGFHKYNIQGLRNLCVDRFFGSITRQKIMDKLEEVISGIQNNGMRGEIWVDGSFLTEKLNPEDSDITLVIQEKDFKLMDDKQRMFLRWFENTSLKPSHNCDNYIFIKGDSIPEQEYMYAYWLRQFGFSRSDEMKGLAVIYVPFLVMP